MTLTVPLIRRNGWCAGKDPEMHAQCPVTWPYFPLTVAPVLTCDCPCHLDAEDRGELW